MGLIKTEFSSKLNAFEVYNLFKEEKDTILLDSSKEDERLSKYSFIGLNPFLIFELKNKKTYIDGNEIKGEPFKILENLINEYKNDLQDDIPLLSGAMGYITYDSGRILEELPDISEEDFISGTKADRVKEIARALQEIDFETYLDKFDMSAFSQNDIYPNIWGYEDEADEIKDDLRNSFENLKKFYEKMAAQESAVLVSIY